MPIEYPCPACQRPLAVPESYLGRNMACPTCSHVFRLGPPPAPPPPAPPPPPRYADRPPRSRDRDRYDRYDDGRRDRDEDRYAFHWRQQASSAWTYGVVALCLSIFALIGMIAGILAWTNAATGL